MDSLLKVRERIYTYAKNNMRDSVRLYAKSALNAAIETNDAHLIVDFTYLYGTGFQLRDRNQALEIYKKAYQLSDSVGYEKMKAHSALKIGGINRIKGYYDTAFFYFDIAKAIIDEVEPGEFALKIMYNANLASYYEAKGSFATATRYYTNALQLSKENDQPESVLHYEFGLAKIHFRLQDYEKSSELLNSALQKARQFQNRAMTASCLQMIGLILASQDVPDSALYIFRDLERYYHPLDSMRRSKLYIMVATSFEEMDQWDSAAVYLEKSKLLTRSEDFVTKANWHLIYSDLLLEKRQIDSALYHAYRSLHFANHLENISIQSEVYGALAVLHALQGTTDSVKSYFDKSMDLYKSSLNENKVAIIEDLRVSYGTAEKEKLISLLKSKNEIQALKSRQKSLIWGGAAFALLLFIIVIVLWYQKKLIRQKHQVSIHKQQLLRSQINPHFIFNALTSIRGYLFDGNDIMTSVNYLGKFAKLMRMVLNHSSLEWVPLEEELQALSLYLEIQKMRFKDSFEFELVIDQSLETDQVMVPPLLAQPFIENAVEHGFKNIDYTGKLDLSCKVEGETIRFEIVDNGIGVDHIAGKKKHESKAHHIFSERLKVLSRLRKTRLHYLIEDLGKYAGKRGTKVEYTVPIEWNYA